MSSPRKRHLLLGLLGGSLPLVLQAAFGALLLAWLGGLDGLSRTLGLAGRPSHLLGLLSLGSMVALMFVLSSLSRGRNVPVVVPVVLATVPWLAGLFGALLYAQGVLEFIPSASQEDLRLGLIQGTGELLRMRLLGAGSSTALLLATAGALFLARVPPPGTKWVPTASHTGDRRLEGVVVLLLALVCALSAVESKGLSELLVATAQFNPLDHAFLLLRDSPPLRTPGWVRPVALAGLIVAGLALGARRLTRKPQDPRAFLLLSPLAVVVAGILWADGRPVARMNEALEQASLPPSELSGVRLLPWGWDYWVEEAPRVDVVATARGLSRPGVGEVPWSANDKVLMDFLREPVANLEKLKLNLEKRRPTRRRLAPALELAVDASIPVAQLRRLIDIATGMDLTTLALVGTRVPEAEAAKLSEALSGTPPILQQVVTALFGPVPRITRVRLLPVLHSSTFTPASTWVAELGAEHRLVLSKTPLGSQTLELELSGPAPESAFAGGDGGPVLFLTVTEQASLEDVASAVRKCQLQGFTVLLSARPPPISRSP